MLLTPHLTLFPYEGDDDHHPSFVPLFDMPSDVNSKSSGAGDKREDDRIHKGVGGYGRGKRGGGVGAMGGRGVGRGRTPPGMGVMEGGGVSPLNVGRGNRSPHTNALSHGGSGETSSPVGGVGRGQRSPTSSHVFHDSPLGKGSRSPGSEGVLRWLGV